MKWLRMKHHSSSGVGYWKYIPLYSDKIDEEEIEETYVVPEAEQYNWSEHFRRIEWEIIPTRRVPNAKIKEAVENIKNRIEWSKESIIKNEERLITMESLVGSGRKIDPDEVERKKREKRHKKVMDKIHRKWEEEAKKNKPT